jgi:S-adenosylmethionine-dependent methyltransferase
VKEDRNFDDLAQKFAQNIYGSEKGEIRQTIVWQDLMEAIDSISPSESLKILDAGGGLAQLSQRLAERGHDIILCDISKEMLKLAQGDIDKNGLCDRFTLIHSPVQKLSDRLSKPVDMVLFHAVMEWLAEPERALQELLKQVRPGGVASVMFYNHHGLVFKNVTCGNIPHVLEGMPHRKRFKLQPQQGLLPEQVYQWIEKAGFEIKGKSGIRSFHDYISDRQFMGDYQFEDVLELEKRLCRQEPYLSLGRYIHVWATKKQK